MKCKFIGCPENNWGNKFYHNKKVVIKSRDAIFVE